METRNIYRIFAGKPLGRQPLGRSEADWRIKLTWTLRNRVMRPGGGF
jgi:hypothetical protein